MLGLNEGETGEVEVFPADTAVVAGDMEALSRLQGFRIARASVQSDGQFRLEGLDPGGYTLLAVVFHPDAEDETDVLSGVRLSSVPVTIQGGETARVTFQIAK